MSANYVLQLMTSPSLKMKDYFEHVPPGAGGIVSKMNMTKFLISFFLSAPAMIIVSYQQTLR